MIYCNKFQFFKLLRKLNKKLPLSSEELGVLGVGVPALQPHAGRYPDDGDPLLQLSGWCGPPGGGAALRGGDGRDLHLWYSQRGGGAHLAQVCSTMLPRFNFRLFFVFGFQVDQVLYLSQYWAGCKNSRGVFEKVLQGERGFSQKQSKKIARCNSFPSSNRFNLSLCNASFFCVFKWVYKMCGCVSLLK